MVDFDVNGVEPPSSATSIISLVRVLMILSRVL